MKKILRLLALIILLNCVVTAFADGLEVYFLNVGQGNAAFITCNGYNMMIDGGPDSASQYVYSFLNKHEVKRIDYMVATHDDEDHVGGLPAALRCASVGVFFSNEEKPSYSKLKKQLDNQDIRIIVPDAGDRFSLGNASVTVLGPRRGTKASGNTSLVLRVEYGKTSFLFVGDSEIEDENQLIDAKAELESTVLCVGHHGSASSSAERFLTRVNPQYAVVSVGKRNSYGHPKQAVLDRLNKMNVIVCRTDEDGEIKFVSDGKSVTVWNENDGWLPSPIPTVSRNLEDVNTEPTFIGNANSKKLHYPWCESVDDMKESNKVPFYGAIKEPIDLGYVACKRCNPSEDDSSR